MEAMEIFYTVGKINDLQVSVSMFDSGGLFVRFDDEQTKKMEQVSGHQHIQEYLQQIREKIIVELDKQAGGSEVLGRLMDNVSTAHNIGKDDIIDNDWSKLKPEVYEREDAAHKAMDHVAQAAIGAVAKEYESKSLPKAVEVTEDMLKQALIVASNDNVAKSLSEISGEIFDNLVELANQRKAKG